MPYQLSLIKRVLKGERPQMLKRGTLGNGSARVRGEEHQTEGQINHHLHPSK